MKQPRFYREWVKSDLVGFTTRDCQTDIFVSAEKDLKNESRELVRRYRNDIISYIKTKPEFEKSLTPLPADDKAPDIIRAMLKASTLAGVGPMAAVAGAIAEFVGKGLLQFTGQVILENGGDIFIKTNTERKIGIYAGNSPLSGRIAIKVNPEVTPVGICTSSGTVGHSLSFGNADAVCVMAKEASLADACATACCNKVKTEREIEEALDFAKSVEGIIGAMVIYKDKVGSIGNIELMRGA
ncbi:MAG: UPF0280 family protein [Candidatus Omnitrophica bacterium]|nr:UPF0280 family protein [Candidatus Omnitrophota bacterium]